MKSIDVKEIKVNGMKVGLNCGDRLTLCGPGVMPESGSAMTIILRDSIVEKCRVTAKDAVEFGLPTEEKVTQVTWNEKGVEDREFELLDAEVELIKRQLSKLDKEEKLSTWTMRLYKKFISDVGAKNG